MKSWPTKRRHHCCWQQLVIPRIMRLSCIWLTSSCRTISTRATSGTTPTLLAFRFQTHFSRILKQSRRRVNCFSRSPEVTHFKENQKQCLGNCGAKSTPPCLLFPTKGQIAICVYCIWPKWPLEPYLLGSEHNGCVSFHTGLCIGDATLCCDAGIDHWSIPASLEHNPALQPNNCIGECFPVTRPV